MSPLRILVTGSRKWDDRTVIRRALLDALDRHPIDDRPGKPVLVHGDAHGADRLAASEWRSLPHRFQYTEGTPPAWWSRHLDIEAHPALWWECGPSCPRTPRHRRPFRQGDGDYCPTAGPRRNLHMVTLGADVVLAFPLGASPGTRGCMRLAEKAGIRVVNYGDKEPA